MVDSSPELFRRQLASWPTSVLRKDREERVVFINAWNEWAEGMYLEPDTQFGHGYLEAVASVLAEAAGRGSAAAAHGPQNPSPLAIVRSGMSEIKNSIV